MEPKIFFVKINVTLLLTEVMKVPPNQRGRWITNLAFNLATNSPSTEFENYLLSDAKKRQETNRLNGSKGGKAKARLKPRHSKATARLKQEVILEVKEEKNKEKPDWFPVEEWNAFIAMRQEIKKPVKETAESAIIKKLTLLREEGHDPAKVLLRSVENQWQGLFPDESTKVLKAKVFSMQGY